MGVRSAVVVGGIDIMTQALVLAKKPHVVIGKYLVLFSAGAVIVVILATPGRLVDHLENTKGFNLRSIKYLVMDEADRILDMNFQTEVCETFRNVTIYYADPGGQDINSGPT